MFGVIGDPVGHSLSPLMHNTAFVSEKVNAVYLPFLVEELREFSEPPFRSSVFVASASRSRTNRKS